MKRIILSTILLAAAMTFALSLGCDSGSDGPGDDTLAPEDTVDPGTEPFVGMVEGFGMDGNLVSGVTVELFDNATGKGTGITQVSDADGYVTFSDLEKGGLYGFKSTLDNYKDTFVWNIEVGAVAEETLWIVPNTVYQMALGLAGLTQDAGKSVVAGAVYWLDGAGEEVGIGCASVVSESGEGDFRYMAADNGLPTTLANQPATACSGTEGNGRYVAANLPAGAQIELIATGEGDAELGRTILWSIADSIAVSNIYMTENTAANPTPGSCGCE